MTMKYPFSDWLSPLSKNSSLDLLRDFGSMLLDGHKPPSTSHLYGAFCAARVALADCDYGALGNLSDLYRYDQLSIEDCELLRVLRQVQALFQKNNALDLGIDTERIAYEKFLAAEQACSETNAFFRLWRSGRLAPLPPLALVLDKARRLISYVLGPCPPMSKLPFSFGPGATTTVKQKRATVQSKLAESPTCSESLARSALLPSLLREMPHWLEEHQKATYVDDDGYEVAVLDVQVSTSRLVFVPKTAFTKRSIITQPTLNSFFQLGIGNYIARRLKRRAGVDITDQTRNQRLARQGSLDGSLATVDLSSASDTISLELVRYLLPPEWYVLLSSARCQDYIYGDVCRRLEHFSAMGNGFTFPLETLIFWALARTCVRSGGTVSVYGDDIIVPSEDYEQLCYVLRAAGFSPNKTKSFSSGPFRESCGADYFYGIDIRPTYVKDVISVETLYVLHNFFYRASRLDEANYLHDLIPDHLRLYGPDGYGDGHLLRDDPSPYLKRTRRLKRSGWGGFLFRSFRRIGTKQISLYPGDYITPLYVLYVRGDNPDITSHILDGRPLPTPMEFAKDGRPLYDRRGSAGYEEVSIYTFH